MREKKLNRLSGFGDQSMDFQPIDAMQAHA
jgi:hypothetical protein